MAIFGIQIVFSLTLISFFQKLNRYYSLGQTLLCKDLFRYVAPTDKELKGLVQGTSTTGGQANKSKSSSTPGSAPEFLVPKSILTNIVLQRQAIMAQEVILLPHYHTLEWLCDFSALCGVVYLFTKSYDLLKILFLKQSDDNPDYSNNTTTMIIDVSACWNGLACFFVLKALTSITASYIFKPINGPYEKSVVLIMGFMFASISLIALCLDPHLSPNILPAKGVTSAVTGEGEIYNSYDTYVKDDHHKGFAPTTFNLSPFHKIKAVYAITLSTAVGYVASLLFFPAIRWSQMYLDALTFASTSSQKLLMHMNCVVPLITCALSLRPLENGVNNWIQTSNSPYINWGFNVSHIKYLCMVLYCLTNTLLLRPHLQAYLNLAYQKLADLKASSANKISNKTIRNTVNRIYVYVNVTAIQFLAPSLLFAFLALTLLTPQQSPHSTGTSEDDWMELAAKYLPDAWSATLRGSSVKNKALSALVSALFRRSSLDYLLDMGNAAWCTSVLLGIVHHRNSWNLGTL